MPATLPIQIGERTVTVRELTVREVRDWAVQVDTGLLSLDGVDELMLPDCSLADLQRMSDADGDLLDTLTPSELEPIAEAARKLNPHFFRLRAALAGAARALTHEAQRLTSSAAP